MHCEIALVSNCVKSMVSTFWPTDNIAKLLMLTKLHSRDITVILKFFDIAKHAGRLKS